MIMGCEKRVIVVKDTGSNMFDEAYFIVKSSAEGNERCDFLREANRIIASRTVKLAKRRRMFTALWIASGFLSGAVMTFTAFVFLT